MMIDLGTAMIVIFILTIIAFLKGWAHERKNVNPLDKYSERDIQRFEAYLRDIQEAKAKDKTWNKDSQ